MNRIAVTLAVAMLVICSGIPEAPGDDGQLDLTMFDHGQGSPYAVQDGEASPQEFGQWFAPAAPRWYLSAMVGPAFTTLDFVEGPLSVETDDTVVAAGGAFGMAMVRWCGQFRLEIEGAGRDTFVGPTSVVPGASLIARSNWSVLANAWRDLMLTRRFGVYGGAGVGIVGYQIGVSDGLVTSFDPPCSVFAWQYGGGLIYKATERLTLDVGYRWFQTDRFTDPFPVSHQFSASEVMFSLRLYDPFRRWWE